MSITPQRVERLRDNEIFVFGCRNSGRHWDGASAFALENFGAVMGQREGLQGFSCDRYRVWWRWLETISNCTHVP